MNAPYRTVLVGTDGSITAGRAVQRAVELTVVCEGRLLVAYVGEADTGRTVLDGVERQYAGSGVVLDVRLLTGDPADALLGLAEAERVDAVVVGNKGMAGAQRFLLGSVPNRVSHRANCDVVVVHTTKRD